MKPLPDEVVMEILSRLPVDEVLKFRSVCRRWSSLISTQYFGQMHLKTKSLPLILVQETAAYDLILIDEWELPGNGTRTRKLLLNSITSESMKSYDVLLSYNGIIVMKRQNVYNQNLKDFIIFNPITRDKVSIMSAIPGGGGDIIGMFFHPQIKEYCIIWGLLKVPHVQFKILSLGAQACIRDLKPPPSWGYQPKHGAVVINNATVYWMVGDRCQDFHQYRLVDRPSCEELIMAFDIKTEEFSVIPHPGITDDGHSCDRTHLAASILEMDGCLCFVQSINTATSGIIKIWTLQDSGTQFWVKSHTVNIIDNTSEPLNYEYLQAVTVGNGELLMVDVDARLYACNLELGTLRTFGRSAHWKYKLYRLGSIFVPHIPSFIPLKDCKSEILMQ